MSQYQEVRRGYISVDFPEEKTDEVIPMALISSDWLFEEDGNLYSLWPTYLKSTTQREKAVINHQKLKYERCLKCPVAIKYSTDDYKKASMKLRLLEEEQSQSEESSSQISNNKVSRGNRNEDFVYSDESFDDIPPVPPVPPKLKITTSVPSPSRERNKTFKKKTYSVLKPVQPFQTSELNIEETSTNEKLKNNNQFSPCTCEQNTRILTNLVKEVQMLKDDIRHLLRLHADKENIEIEIDKNTIQIKRYEDLKQFNVELNDVDFKKCLSKFGLTGGKDNRDNKKNYKTYDKP